MVYKFAGKKYEQKELTFEELGKVREFVKDSFLDVEYLNQSNIIKLIDDIYDKGLLEKVFEIILKPVVPKYYYLFSWYFKKYEFVNPVKLMSMSEIASVVTDFFILNFGWINNLLGSGNNLISIIQNQNLTKPPKIQGLNTND